MLKRYKDLMRTLVSELRHILVGNMHANGTIIRGDLDRELERLGIASDGTLAPFDVLAIATPDERQAYRVAATQLEACDKAQRASTRVEIVERAAYSWINRLLALRAMETRGLIEETLRTNPEYDGIPEALFILRQSEPGRTSGADGGRWAMLEDACATQATALPGLFARNDPATALRPSTPALIHCLRLVGGTMEGFTLAESDAAFDDPDAIGWAYQFYQEEAKAEIYAKLGRGGKVTTRAEIAAATQLFTEPYMVKWLLQNSLGRSYHEIYPDSTLPTAWEYYIKPDQLDTSTTFNLASLTLLDPCMGSGHFLREAFDMFVAMYREQFHTFSAAEIADRILSYHLYGIDIDPRAAQLSALTLYLRAWELVRDERRKERKSGPGTYTPPAMNLATTPTSLTEGALQRHLHRHPRYAVVVTNPPYMGSKNMDAPLKKYIEKYYSSGKRDLYAAFILRCLELCLPNGRVAMVTQQSWMFLSSYTDLRALTTKLKQTSKEVFIGLLRDTSIEVLAHLGPRAFDPDNKFHDGVAVVLFSMRNIIPVASFRIIASDTVGSRGPELKDAVLRELARGNGNRYSPVQADFLAIEGYSLSYKLTPPIASLLQSTVLGDVATVLIGLIPKNLPRFVRYLWEPPHKTKRWVSYSKAGGYCKWDGLNDYNVEWEYDGMRINATGIAVIPSREWYFSNGLSYTAFAAGCLSVRRMTDSIFSNIGPAIFTNHLSDLNSIMACMNSHLTSYICRQLNPKHALEKNLLVRLPVVKTPLISKLGSLANTLKYYLLSNSPSDRNFTHKIDCSEYEAVQIRDDNIGLFTLKVSAILHLIEGMLESEIFLCFGLPEKECQDVLNDTGTPTGWYPLIVDYDNIPTPPQSIKLPPFPQELFDYIAMHKYIRPNKKELVHIKARLRSFYEAGLGEKIIEQEEVFELDEGEEEVMLGAHIPTETFLEELSVKMQLHPISVYWLLEELRGEGGRCKPEEQRLLEDRLSVLVLRLLGHRWPKQLEAGEPVPDWADSDGIIPLVLVTGEATLAEQLRVRLRAEDGELGVQQTEALLAELMNVSLEEWLRRRFFSRHISQFKYRPIALHLVSTPINNSKKKRGGSQRTPAFECLLYYHACTGDALARIRTQYVEPLLRAERQRMVDASLFQDETTSALANDRVQELVAFVEKLRFIEERGFACPELDKIIVEEPLDRWSGDGYLPPANRDELLHNEQAWHVDINDGVRVNIAPLQLAGVLASDVLKVVDAKKALADRARWRADERRWVRDGKLPRCGWMHEQVPESPRWTEREPQRIAEQHKLEQKRLAIQHKQTEEVGL